MWFHKEIQRAHGLEVMRTAYARAIEAGYRFYSYGDASLLLPHRSSSDVLP